MQNQEPPSNVTLGASLAFFGILGLIVAGMGVASLGGDDPGAIWAVLIGGGIALGALLLAPVVFKGAEKQRKAYAKQQKKHHVEEDEPPVHHQKGSGIDDLFSGLGSIVVILIVLVVGFFVVRGAWNFAQDKFGPEDYTAFFYYDPNDLDKYWQANVSSIEDCRDWVNAQVSRDFDGNYDYECGVNCKYDAGYSGYVCKETLE